MILDLLLSQWKLVLIAALIAALSFQTHRLSNAEAEIVEASTRFHLAIDAAKAETKKAEIQSERVKNELNAEIPKLVAEAKANAVELYKRRYQRVEGVNATANLGSGIGSGNTSNVGVFNSGNDTTSTVQANNSKGTDSSTTSMDASNTCDPRFISEAAEAAAIIYGWNQWANLNGFPREH